jgi:hypothetical protein
MEVNMAFSFASNWGIIVLGVYLIVVGISTLVTGFVIPPVVHGVLALVAGVLLLLNR